MESYYRSLYFFVISNIRLKSARYRSLQLTFRSPRQCLGKYQAKSQAWNRAMAGSKMIR